MQIKTKPRANILANVVKSFKKLLKSTYVNEMKVIYKWATLRSSSIRNGFVIIANLSNESRKNLLLKPTMIKIKQGKKVRWK